MIEPAESHPGESRYRRLIDMVPGLKEPGKVILPVIAEVVPGFGGPAVVDAFDKSFTRIIVIRGIGRGSLFCQEAVGE